MMQTFVLGAEKVFWWSNNDRWEHPNQNGKLLGLFKKDDPYDPKPSMGIYKFLVERIEDAGQIISLNTPHSNVIALQGPNVLDSNTVILAFYKVTDDIYEVEVKMTNLGSTILWKITPDATNPSGFADDNITEPGGMSDFLNIGVIPLLLIADSDYELTWSSNYPPQEPGDPTT